MAEHENPAEADLQLKKRARRRLVGAIALALLAVIVLPMVMDREPRPGNQDIQVRIPSQDGGGLATKVLPGKVTSSPLPAPEPKTVSEPVPGAQARPEAAGGTPAAPTEPGKAEPGKAKSAEPVPKPPAPPVAEKPKPPEAPAKQAAPARPVTKPAADPKPATAKAPPSSAPAKPAGEAKGASTGGEPWVVQLGAYRESGNVKLLMSKIKGLGLPAYTEKYDSPQGPRTRVRAGPFPSKEAAEKARERIKIIGVDGPVAPK